MGSAQSILTPEAASAITTGVIVAGAIAIGVSTQQTTTDTDKPSKGFTSPSNASKKGKRKKSKTEAAATSASDSLTAGLLTTPSVQPQVVEAPTVIPGGFATLYSSETSQNAPKKKNKKGKKTKTAPADDTTASTTPQQSLGQQSSTLKDSTASLDTDSSWTRVQSSAKGLQQTRPVESTDTEGDVPTTDDDQLPLSSSAERSGSTRRPLAERLLPKPRKTGVEDMLQTPDYPPIARVVRAKPGPGQQLDLGSSWASHDDLTSSVAESTEAEREDDEGWGVVKSRSNRSSEFLQKRILFFCCRCLSMTVSLCLAFHAMLVWRIFSVIYE
jgi:hypothetical protein